MINRDIDKSNNALGLILKFINKSFSEKEKIIIKEELFKIEDFPLYEIEKIPDSFWSLQEQLSKINEKSIRRKENGVYYTPFDVVYYIVINTIKLWNQKLSPINLHVKNLNGIPYLRTSFKAKFFDPTCGVGEFILSSLDIKLDLVEMHKRNLSKIDVHSLVNTVFGNDINVESIKIAKMRILMKILERYGASYLTGISNILNKNFKTYDFVQEIFKEKNKYDIIIGNPPYIEDKKYNMKLIEKYGNIYANILENSSKILSGKGTMGFIIPLSYISTPRMSKIRTLMEERFNRHYLLSFSDRPDSLFSSVHQKLCICFFGNEDEGKHFYTSSYNYWYKNEREILFENLYAIENTFIDNGYIPKIGNQNASVIYRKILKGQKTLFEALNNNVGQALYLNMRATFWIKVFSFPQKSSEYKEYKCDPKNVDFIYCLLNSSLFWWYWICVSDCWHITQKELKTFFVPSEVNMSEFGTLAVELKKKLESTKVFVGTKQIDYEYKHRDCIEVISKIDDLINDIYQLTEEESKYVKNFALKYRTGGKNL